MPDFIKFSGEDNRSTHDHISQYLSQSRDASSIDTLKAHMFSLSLFGTPFFWFASLALSLINSWFDIDKKFHEHFFFGSNE